MPELHVLRVFCGEAGSGGNPLGVFLDGAEVRRQDRQGIAGRARVHRDGVRRRRGARRDADLHPGRGAAVRRASRWWGRPGSWPASAAAVAALRPPAGEVPVREDGGLTYAAARPEWSPEFEFVELGSPAEVEALDGPPEGHDAVGVWAWIDEGAGIVRERVFAPRYGIAEDEATGSAAITLSARLGRELDIRQGAGSRILARPLDDGMVEIGGRVELERGARASAVDRRSVGALGIEPRPADQRSAAATVGPRPAATLASSMAAGAGAITSYEGAGDPRVGHATAGWRRKLTEYERKRSFDKTPEPRGGRGRRRGRPLRRPGAPRSAAALGPAAGAGRRARLVGAAEGGAAGPEGEPAGRPHRGPSARVPRRSRARSRRASTARGR